MRLAAACSALAALLVAASPARAVVDIFDRGTQLIAGKFNLRVTNAGLVGNPFPNLSFDPSFEYPRGSGQELLEYAALWVGALTADGRPHVSGGPLLEFRPTLAADDTIVELWHGRLGGRRAEDDDGDGRIDEEIYNHRDDDGDGVIDEDLGIIGQQMLAADYTDDQPEAIAAVPGGEVHTPLGLSVHQEVYGWSTQGYDGIAGIQFTITNHSNAILRNVYLGLYANLDVRPRGDRTGHLNDTVRRLSFSRSISKGTTRVYADGADTLTIPCFTSIARSVPVVCEPATSATPDLPVIAVLPLEHTTDPLASLLPALARAPRGDTFRTSVFAVDRPLNSGRPPLLDAERYAALQGLWPQSPDTYVGDQHVLVSCGPFRTLAPGQRLDFAVALVAAAGLDSIAVALGNAAFLHNGTELNLLPDEQGPHAIYWDAGETGINGHEVCIDVPEGVTFRHDPHCPMKFASGTGDPPGSREVTYRHGTCVWTDVDCNICTGMNGRETVIRWVDLQSVPPAPTYRVIPGDHSVRIEWDNMPEILARAGKSGPQNGRFIGYRLWRLSDWRDRASLLPPRERWEALGTYGYDDADSKLPLASITDSTLDFLRIWYEQKLYPVGRYAAVDRQPLDGFDYIYMVTSIVETRTPFAGFERVQRYESPLTAGFAERVVPRVEARSDAQSVWVVPNPFRARADWDRSPTDADRLTRHLDFMGLPRARCTIRVWTLAGDHVATIEHDGTRGSGQASWNLVSRNGQEVASGVYIFTVESALGNARGRFVVIR